MGMVDFRVAPSFSHGLCCVSTMGSTKCGSHGMFKYQCQQYYTLENPLPLGALGLNTFNHSWTSGELCVFFSCISSPSSVQVSGRSCHSSAQISYASGTLLDGGSFSSYSSQYFGRHSSMVSKNKKSYPGCFSRLVLKGMQSLHLTLWLFRDMCCADKGSLSWSFRL